MGHRAWASGLLLCIWAHAAHGEDPWADVLLAHGVVNPNPGFEEPQAAVGAPSGGTTASPNNTGVASIGTTGSFITLAFDTPVTNDALNPMGLDFIVFSNAFWTGGDNTIRFTEPALVEVSRDANSNGLADDAWYVMPGSRAMAQSVVPDGIANPTPALCHLPETPSPMAPGQRRRGIRLGLCRTLAHATGIPRQLYAARRSADHRPHAAQRRRRRLRHCVGREWRGRTRESS